ncbi:MAG TPA: glycosyltransferase 87 family protein [Acidimicrobiales bacterium]
MGQPRSERDDRGNRGDETRGRWASLTSASLSGDALALRIGTIAADRGWGWPVLAAAVGFAGATVLALFHQQLDLSTYLLGGAHASSDDLFTVTYPTDHLGFTYPPFSALLFAPFAHLPARVCEVGFSWINLAALFGMIVVSLRAVCRSLDKRTLVWWGLALVLPVLLFDPVRQTFLLGQVNIILALMIVADLTMDLPLPRGILVGLAAAVKVTPIILIPYLLLTRQGRSGLRAIAAFLGAALLAVAVNASTSWSYWTHYIRDPQRAGMLSWVGNQGVLGAVERMLGHTVTTPTTFVIVVTVGVLGLLVAAGAYRRSSPVLGLLVVEATESLASPVSWSHHFIWMILLVAWLALAEDRPRAGEWYALGVAVLLWAAPYWWVPHGPSVRFAGRGWLLPVGNAYVLVFMVLLIGAAVRVVRSTLQHPVRLGRRTMAPTAAGGS